MEIILTIFHLLYAYLFNKTMLYIHSEPQTKKLNATTEIVCCGFKPREGGGGGLTGGWGYVVKKNEKKTKMLPLCWVDSKYYEMQCVRETMLKQG